VLPQPYGTDQGGVVLGFSSDVYNTFKFIHIVAAIVWVGAGLFFQFQATRLSRLDDPARLGAFTKDVAFAGQRLLLPASAVVLLAGIAMVIYSPALDFSDTWIAIGLIGYAATAITGSVFIGPTAGKIGDAIEADGPNAPSVVAMQRKIFMVSRIDQLVLLIVIAAMVFKPGA
jgi:uncharacterized membrane protein